jgi:hypothetical protein
MLKSATGIGNRSATKRSGHERPGPKSRHALHGKRLKQKKKLGARKRERAVQRPRQQSVPSGTPRSSS